MSDPLLVVVLKGYPRLSETFIAQELLGLERAGLRLFLVSLRHPTDTRIHPVHREIKAPVHYLPEYLHEEPLRVARAALSGLRLPGFRAAFGAFWRDLKRDITRNRVRRFGQALVMAAELPPGNLWIHAHFAHTPASVARYCALLRGQSFTISAHAKDIWTSPDWELAEKMAQARWTVTCTASGRDHLAGLAPGAAVHLAYHGLDLDRFPPFAGTRPPRDGSASADPVQILSVGRAVPKKGYDVLLRALAKLPPGLHWRLTHIGGGGELEGLQALAHELSLDGRITWQGALAQEDVLAAYRRADLFVLASRRTPEGDRDGLPNVIVEAASQGLMPIGTELSGIPEFVTEGETGLLCPPEDPQALAAVLTRAITTPGLRARLGAAAEARVRTEFDARPGITRLTALFRSAWGG
ncbi:glycosyltransferase family 4 protein [Rhodobacter maris]|uniref:Glycosyltransferase involved in cell wall bisynthesis n=1 Tax=Rhodobacter maris TaxID=446682 RepID=A0A285TE88_9RHOB|nr:glycosyltransferase family 4 protein [Rhodobacter maris]SOC18281.1 glycosyltransferase involved in cell wall bisynthesis [Rhodobacter maris]